MSFYNDKSFYFVKGVSMIRKGKITVESYMPEELKGLKELAYNIWWTYNSEYIDLLSYIDPDLVKRCSSNPFVFFEKVSIKRLHELINNSGFMEKYAGVINHFEEYMKSSDTWFDKTYPGHKDRKIAYFSAEYGLHEVLPTYSGGLGVLSGDHMKSASDMGIPMVGIGLFYKHGYFNQTVNYEGWQQSGYSTLDTSLLPMRLVLDDSDKPLTVKIDFPGRKVTLRVWSVAVGRITLYYLDSDNDLNNPADRELTSSLYGGNSETRIQQEMLMGIGGVKLLDELGIDCDIYHLNEGHQAFVILELLKKFITKESLSFNEAKQAVTAKTLFTTHTPVPAGIDVFSAYLAEKYLHSYIEKFGITKEEFFQFASNFNDTSHFNMAALALNFSSFKNGVSRLHGQVSRSLFSWLWPDVPKEEIPISHITNGIHTLSWINPKLRSLFDKYFDRNWRKGIHEQQVWEMVSKIPDDEIWVAHNEIKKDSIDCFRKSLVNSMESSVTPDEADLILDKDALTIGFARRFATYKRATLIFRDLERLKKLITSTKRPIQIIFAGKAHPADRQGQEFIKRIVEISRQEPFKGKILFLENYNILIARHLVQGVDIWLNNPRRPLEASGTSGQKAAINGVVNFSVSDGWWHEGYNGHNGFVIGREEAYTNHQLEDDHDSISIYSQLENDIIPMFFDRNERNVPHRWVKLMKESIRSCGAKYSSDRMIKDYTDMMYVPAIDHSDLMESNANENSKKLAEYASSLSSRWNGLNIYSFNGSLNLTAMDIKPGASSEVFVDLYLADVKPSEVLVQLCIEKGDGDFHFPETHEMSYIKDILNGCHRYHVVMPALDTGKYLYSFRILPKHEHLVSAFDLKLIRWA